MKNKIIKKSTSWLVLLLVIGFVISPFQVVYVNAASCESFNVKTDIDYTGGKGADIELKHTEQEGGAVTASYTLDDTRLTRNASYYMSMRVKFSNSHSWAIRVRNVTCEMDGKTITGDMQFHVFDKQGTLQIAGKSIDNWPKFNNIEDDKWHTVTVQSTVDSFEFWVDGIRAAGLYYNSDVSNLSTNYTCPKIMMSGLNDGVIKDICIWNDGKEENPVMPADKVAQSIEALPDVISMKKSDAENVMKVSQSYEVLDENEKKYVINYDKLQQLLNALGSNESALSIWVSGSKNASFSSLFPDNVISHTEKMGNTKYYFETEAGRKATVYTRFVVNMTEESNCFDVYLRNQKHTANGKTVSGVISLRMFKNSAAVVDSGNNRISEFVNYTKINLLKGSHVVTVESSPTSCVIWIDEVRYEVPGYLSNVADVDYLQATSGFYIGKTVEGTISNIRVWCKTNTLTKADKVRVSIFNLPQLSELTLEHKEQVKKLRKAYVELSDKEQKYVTNLSKLERTERAIAYIEEKGNKASLFLSNELPVVTKDYLNLISTGTYNVPPSLSSLVSYNASTHDIAFKDSGSYITTTFKDLKGIDEDDTYLIKFTYKPVEYYYETPTAGWMGLRITFSGYEVGGNGQKTVNKTQFAFMTSQCAILSRANGNSMPSDYLTTFAPELGEEYHVSMLCEQGKMKIWVNGEAVAYYDQLPEYPLALEFEGSRCKGDVKNIQLYNMSNPTEPELTETSTGGFKMIADPLYDVEGISAQERVEQKKSEFVIALILFAIVFCSCAIVVFCNVKNVKKNSVKRKGAEKNVK